MEGKFCFFSEAYGWLLSPYAPKGGAAIVKLTMELKTYFFRYGIPFTFYFKKKRCICMSATDITSSETPVVITSRYWNKCSRCGGKIHPGARIEWNPKDPKKKVRHVQCPQVEEKAQTVSNDILSKLQDDVRCLRKDVDTVMEHLTMIVSVVAEFATKLQGPQSDQD